jgi:hypothetical protein
VTNSSAIENGGWLFGYESATGATSGTISITNIQYSQMLAGKSGGLMFLNTGMIKDLIFDKITIIDSKSISENGGVMYLSSRYDGTVSINNGHFDNVYAKFEGSFFYSDSLQLYLTIQKNTIRCLLAYNSTFIAEDQTNNSF